MISDGNAELILLTIPICNSSQEKPNLKAINDATADATINTIWLLPSKEASPKTATLIDNKIIKNIIGKIASKNVGEFFITFCID